MHNVDPESFLAKNRAGAVMSYWTRIYKKTLEHVLFLPEAASSFAEILYKYILESKATTPNSSRCLLHSVPNWMRSPGAQCHGYMLSVLSFSLHRVGKDVSLTCLNCLCSGCTMTTAASAAGAGALRVPLPVFKGFKTLIWTHHIWYAAQHSLRHYAYHSLSCCSWSEN